MDGIYYFWSCCWFSFGTNTDVGLFPTTIRRVILEWWKNLVKTFFVRFNAKSKHVFVSNLDENDLYRKQEAMLAARMKMQEAQNRMSAQHIEMEKQVRIKISFPLFQFFILLIFSEKKKKSERNWKNGKNS